MGKSSATENDGFSAVMQQLSAEAQKSFSPPMAAETKALTDGTALGQLKMELQAFTGKFEAFEEIISRQLQELATTLAHAPAADYTERFQKIDDQLAQIRSTESVNQRLFDSLHDELLKYRDNFLHESLQKPFIHDLVHLFDDLISLSEQLRTAAADHGTRGNVVQWRDNLENAIHALVEILHRFEVKEIEPKEFVDRTIHKVVSYEPAAYAEEDGSIVMRVRRGFFWRGKLIRPEEVIAKRFD